MPLNTNGSIKFSDLRKEFVILGDTNNSIKFSNYYVNSSSNLSFKYKIPELAIIPSINTNINLSKYRGIGKNLFTINVTSSESITTTIPTIETVTGTTTYYYLKLLHQGSINTSTINNYTDYSITFPIPITAEILLVGGGGGGGSGLGTGGGAGNIINIQSFSFKANIPYKIRIGAGGLGMQTATDNATIDGTSSILFDEANNQLLTALGGIRGYGSSIISPISVRNNSIKIITNTSITLVTNAYISYNCSTFSSIVAGTYNITFSREFITVGSLAANYSFPILNTSPVPLLWYKFETSSTFLNEATMNPSYNLTNYGTTFNTTYFIKGGRTVNFYPNQYLELPTTLNLNSINTTTGITFSLWFYLNAGTGGWSRIFDFGTCTNVVSGNGSRFILICKAGDAANQLYFQISTATTDGNTADTNDRVQIGYTAATWYHAVWTISTTGYWNIYINNTNIYSGQKVIIPPFTISNKRYYLGKSLYSSDSYLNGYIGDFRIYAAILNLTQVTELYNGRVDIKYSLFNYINDIELRQIITPYINNNSQLYGYGSLVYNTFNYTGTIQTFIIPPNVHYITIYCWGAGGGGSYGYIIGSQGGYGGNGGFVKTTLDVRSIYSLSIIVGQGGRKGIYAATTAYAFGGGGSTAGAYNDGHWAFGGGGGLSGVFITNTNMTITNNIINSYATPIIIAGGGGGAGSHDSIFGGNAGGLVGNNCDYGNGGTGGTQTTGGGPAAMPADNAGNKYKGGNCINYGGGGGGGYYGGGASTTNSGSYSAGGGGGSSYVNTTEFILSNTYMPNPNPNGTRTSLGNTYSYYQTNIGLGSGLGLNDGNNGLVVIEYFIIENTTYKIGGISGGTTSNGTNGSAGKLITITGNNEYYAAEGGGSSYNGTQGLGGISTSGVYLGGNGTNNSSSVKISNAVANTGSGGGGSACDGANQQIGGNGSAGICIIKYTPFMYNPSLSESSLSITNVNWVPNVNNQLTATINSLNYIIGFSSAYIAWGGNWPHILLDRNTSTFWRVGIYNYMGGFYNGGSLLSNECFGDWVWYKLPYTLMLKEYRVIRQGEGIPYLWRIYGSNDANNWEHIPEAAMTSSFASYDSNSTCTKTLTTYSKPYRYFSINMLLAGGAGDGTCVTAGFEVAGMVYNLTNIVYTPNEPTYIWQFINNTDISGGEVVLEQVLSKNTNTIDSILGTVISNESYLGVFIYDKINEVSYNYWLVRFFSLPSTVTAIYSRYGNYTNNYPNNRYTYIHIARATANNVYVSNSNISSFTNSGISIKPSSIYANYTGNGPFTLNGNNITQWNDISGNNRHIIKYRGSPTKSTFTCGTCGTISSSSFNTVKGTYNDGFQLPKALPINHTFVYVARYIGDKNTTSNNRRIFDSDVGIANCLWCFYEYISCRTHKKNIGWVTTTIPRMTDPNYWIIGIETNISSRFNGINCTNNYCNYGNNYSFPPRIGHCPLVTINYGYVPEVYGGGEIGNWEIAEIIIYDSELTENEQITLENYLAVKYNHFSFKSVVPTISDYKALTTQTGTYDLWYNIWDGGQYGYSNLKWYGPGWGNFFNIGTNWYWGYLWANTEVVSNSSYMNRNMQNKSITWTNPCGATNLYIVAGGGGGGGGGNNGGGGGGGGLIIINKHNLSKTKFYFSIGGIGRGGYYLDANLNTTSGGDTMVQYNNTIITAYGGAQAAQGSRTYGLGGNYDSSAILQYPPIRYNTTSAEKTTILLGKTVYTETINITSDLLYGTGSYIIYSSSSYGQFPKSMLFDYDINNVGTHFALSQYPDGVYNGSNYIKNDYYGDWVIIKLPVPIKLYYYNIIARSGCVYRAPAEWKLYGSNDGNTFDEILDGHQLIRLTASNYNKYNCYTKIINNTTTTFYLYYGICINKSMTNSDAILNFTQLQLFGDEMIRTTITNSTLQKYPPKVYNSVSNEILVEFLDNNQYATVITLNNTDINYGSGMYIIYTSATTNNNTKKTLLNTTTTSEIGVSWDTDQYNSSGTYIGSKYIRSDYIGDWVVIQLPVQILLANYSIYSRNSYESNAPGEWKLYGSNNGYIFFEIPTGSQSSRISTTNYTTNSGKYTITVNTNILYIYYGIVINKLAGNSTILNFTEIEFNGYETINIGGSGGIGTVVDDNNYLGGALYQPTYTLPNATSLWSIINTSSIYNIVSQNSTSVSGNISGNGGLGSRNSIPLDPNARHGQNGGWGFTGIIFDYNYSDIIIFTQTNYNGNYMFLKTGKYYLSNNMITFNNAINSIKVSYGYKVSLYEGDVLNGTVITIKDSISDLNIYNLSNNISSIHVKQLVSIYKENSYTGDFLYLDVGNTNITTLLNWDNTINSIKIPNGHYYKVYCYDTSDYTGTPLILTADTPNLTTLNFGNKISSIFIEQLPAGVGLFYEINYVSGFYNEQPYDDTIYNFANDAISSVYIPPNFGYRVILYEDSYWRGGNITLTESIPNLYNIFDNTTSAYRIQLLTGVRIFKNTNLYGEQYFLLPGKYGLASINWANSINSISIPNGYTVNCYTSSIFTNERQYPPKLYNTIDALTTPITYNNFTAYKINFTLNSTGITYGIGDYTVTFSNRFTIGGTEYGTIHAALLFNYVINTDNSNTADFLNTSITSYDTNGVYIGTRYLATTAYKGDWFFIKLPTKIILTKYRIYGNGTYVARNPALWKIYGSNDGITWEEIVQASISTKLTSTDYSNNSYIYTKTLSIPSQEYNYIGCCVSAIISGSEFSFVEFQIFGQEYNNLSPVNIALTSNVQDLSSLNYANNINSLIITAI